MKDSQLIVANDTVTVVPTSGPVITMKDDGTGSAVTITTALNHQMQQLSLSDCVASAVDRCGNTLFPNVEGKVVRITSDEPDGGDHGYAAHGNSDMQYSGSSFALRRERLGAGDGRVYKITFRITDAQGNTTEDTCRIQVPHNVNGPNAVDSGVAACVGDGC
jgi:hypothetical protein